MYLMSNCPSPLLGAPGSSSAVKARVDCMVRYRLLGPLEVESEAGRVDIGPPKRRAVLGALLLARGRVVSADRLNESRAGVIMVVPCTTTRRGLPSHVEIEPDRSGLDAISYAKCEDVKSVSDHRLINRLGVADDEALFAIAKGLCFLLDF